MSLGVGPGALESPAGPRGRGRGQGHTWQQLQALILGRQPVPLALPAPFGAEYVLGGGLGVLAHAEGLTGGLRGKVVRAEELGGASCGRRSWACWVPSCRLPFLGLREQRGPGAGGAIRGSQTTVTSAAIVAGGRLGWKWGRSLWHLVLQPTSCLAIRSHAFVSHSLVT